MINDHNHPHVATATPIHQQHGTAQGQPYPNQNPPYPTAHVASQGQPYPAQQYGQPYQHQSYAQQPSAQGYPYGQSNQYSGNVQHAQFVQQSGAPQQHKHYGGQSAYPPTQTGGYAAQGQNNGQTNYNPNDTIDKMNITIRHGFIQKVFGILTVQLIFTFGLILAFTFYEPLNTYARRSSGLFYGALAISIGCICYLSCSENAARTYPKNYIILGVFTIAEGLLLGIVSSRYDPLAVVMAMGTTIVLTIGLTCFACQVKYDFTGMGPYLFGFLIVLIIIGIFAIFFPGLSVLYAGLGALLFSMYIVYDVQLVVGGKHKKYQYGVDDYVMATINIYLDIVNLFLMLLSLFSSDN